ncbi:MAG: transketolase [Pseudomonadales bacterium]|nr:transketolase [Pseudomonadales bacterium]
MISQQAQSIELAKKVRKHVVQMTHRGNSSHVGSALSIVDILSVLYSETLNIDPKTPEMNNRDIFILSKGHAGAAVYATLAESGYFDVAILNDHYQNGSTLSGHVSHKGNPGVDFSTGSLGHGLGVGAGFAYNFLRKRNARRAFVVLSDGECDEGSNWEAIMFAGHHNLNNLTAIVDYNKIQSLASTRETLDLEPFADKWLAFNWAVHECNGHSHDDLSNTLKSTKLEQHKPSVIIAHTTKGKGVSFMENSVLWHYRSPQGDEFKAAMTELNEQETD